MAGSFSFTSNTIFLGFCPLHTIGSIAWLLYRRLMLLVSCISKQLCVCVQILHYCSNPVSILGMSECDSRVIDIHFCFKMSKLCKHCCATRGCSLWKCPTSPSVKLTQISDKGKQSDRIDYGLFKTFWNAFLYVSFKLFQLFKVATTKMPEVFSAILVCLRSNHLPYTTVWLSTGRGQSRRKNTNKNRAETSTLASRSE